MAIIVGRPINGITINGLEWLLDDAGNYELRFEDEEKAKEFLTKKGYTEEDMEWFEFVDVPDYEVIGKYIPAADGRPEIIEREYKGQGYIFKDNEAYYTSLDKVCYIAELSDEKYTHQSFLDIAAGDEGLAETLFDMVDWQMPESLLSDFEDSGEVDYCESCGKVFRCYEKTKCPHCEAPYEREE